MITSEEWQQYKDFVGFNDQDIEALGWVAEPSEFFVGEVIEYLYSFLTSSPMTRDYFTDQALLEHVKQAQTRYFLQLFQSDYDEQYLQSRIDVGIAHKKIGLPFTVYLATYSHYFMFIRPHIFEYIDDEDAAFKVMDAIAKLITLDEMVTSTAFTDYQV